MNNTTPTLWQRIRGSMLLFAIVTSILEVVALAMLVFIVFPQAGMLDVWSMLMLLAVAFPMSLLIWTRYLRPPPPNELSNNTDA